MNIVVCIKQVPGTTKVDIDEKTGVLNRSGVDSKMNPYDLYAIETALRIKETYGGIVKAVTMGPGQAAEVIKEARAMGVDEGIILSDRAFAGADVLATSRALSEVINKLGKFDLIICGKQTTDGDTAQVGPEVAEFLGIPHATNIIAIDNISDDSIIAKADLGEFVQVLDIPFPCLITVEKDLFVPRLPSYKRMCEQSNSEIPIYSLNALSDTDPMKYGLNGSPTQVERIFPPESSNEKVIIDGEGEEIAEFIYQKLREFKFI